MHALVIWDRKVDRQIVQQVTMSVARGIDDDLLAADFLRAIQ
jgi:hypothetical protein